MKTQGCYGVYIISFLSQIHMVLEISGHGDYERIYLTISLLSSSTCNLSSNTGHGFE